uniref:Uncharacterized protein n=1 Tax=Anguilla anguilla TaxID=7936 RepID=A0A0E9X1L3_ANGAN
MHATVMVGEGYAKKKIQKQTKMHRILVHIVSQRNITQHKNKTEWGATGSDDNWRIFITYTTGLIYLLRDNGTHRVTCCRH